MRVWLDYGVEKTYQLSIRAELEMESTSSSVLVPRISCANVNRERGHVGVEARTNVEVSELVVRGIARVGVEELPGSVGVLASNPILLAYKCVAFEFPVLCIVLLGDTELLCCIAHILFISLHCLQVPEHGACEVGRGCQEA